MSRKHRIEELEELVEYQTIVVASFENLIPQGDRLNCDTCGLVVNGHTVDEFESKIFHCDECGDLLWCGRTACEPARLAEYEISPGQKRYLCVNCAQEMGLINNE